MRKRDVERRLRNAERELSRAQASYLRAYGWTESENATGRWFKGNPETSLGVWVVQETAVQVQRDLVRMEKAQ